MKKNDDDCYEKLTFSDNAVRGLHPLIKARKKTPPVSKNIPNAKMTEDEFYTRIDKALEIPQEQWIKYDNELKQELLSEVL